MARPTITENAAPSGGGNPTLGLLNNPSVVQTLIDMVNEHAGALDAIGAGVSGGSTNNHAFVYTATGTETSTFTITFPFTTADATYAIVGQLFGTAIAGNVYEVTTVASTRTTTTVQVVCTSPPSSGDKLVFFLSKVQ